MGERWLAYTKLLEIGPECSLYCEARIVLAQFDSRGKHVSVVFQVVLAQESSLSNSAAVIDIPTLPKQALLRFLQRHVRFTSLVVFPDVGNQPGMDMPA